MPKKNSPPVEKNSNGSKAFHWNTISTPPTLRSDIKSDTFASYRNILTQLEKGEITCNPKLLEEIQAEYSNHGRWQDKGLQMVERLLDFRKCSVDDFVLNKSIYLPDPKVYPEEFENEDLSDTQILSTSLSKLGMPLLSKLHQASVELEGDLFYHCYRRDFLWPLIRYTLSFASTRTEKLSTVLDGYEKQLTMGDHTELPIVFLSKILSSFFTRVLFEQIGERDVAVILNKFQIIKENFSDTIELRIPDAKKIIHGELNADGSSTPQSVSFKVVTFYDDFKKVQFDGDTRINFSRNGPIPKMLNKLYSEYDKFINSDIPREKGRTPTPLSMEEIDPDRKRMSLTKIVKDRRDEIPLYKEIIGVRKQPGKDVAFYLEPKYTYKKK